MADVPIKPLRPLLREERTCRENPYTSVFDRLQTQASAWRRRSASGRDEWSISPNGQNQAVKETPEQIVAQLDRGAAQAVRLAGPMNAPMKKMTRRVK